MLCEHRGSDRITCGSGTHIHVLWANYGRTVGGQTCPGAVYTTECRAGSSLSKVRQLCEKKTTCNLHASNSVFGDPCRGTVKYLEVHYTCGTKSPFCGHNDTLWKMRILSLAVRLDSEYGLDFPDFWKRVYLCLRIAGRTSTQYSNDVYRAVKNGHKIFVVVMEEFGGPI